MNICSVVQRRQVAELVKEILVSVDCHFHLLAGHLVVDGEAAVVVLVHRQERPPDVGQRRDVVLFELPAVEAAGGRDVFDAVFLVVAIVISRSVAMPCGRSSSTTMRLPTFSSSTCAASVREASGDTLTNCSRRFH